MKNNRQLVSVAQIPDSFDFVSDSQEVEPIKQSFKKAKEYDSFFVRAENGGYVSIYGMVGCVPYLSKLATKII